MSGQRQDSLHDQMLTVVSLANKAGCYDAADWLMRGFFEVAVPGCRDAPESESSSISPNSPFGI